ncbi:hypothetical protein V3W47_17235 [Deinococcus sp. YIM 134068]|uniref:hypothetical protein n=1 Tax=Deinococcus lichenicola TaxID=3118910 RepID=UPI002F92E61A
MERRLPEAVRERTPVEKLVWLYVRQYPGQHSVASLDKALGVYPARALNALVDAGLLIEEEPPTRMKGGKYRAILPSPEEAAA